MLERGAKSVSIAVLLDKKVKREVDFEADHIGFECPDHFVVGTAWTWPMRFGSCRLWGWWLGSENCSDQ